MNYIYYNKETKKEELVGTERWAWEVIYKDGSDLMQFDEYGKFHRFAEIDQKEVSLFRMYKMDDYKKTFDIWPEGAQIFHFYRNTVLNVGTEDETRTRVYVFGFKNKNGAIYHYIMPDDEIIKTIGDTLEIS